ncbi:MAG: ribonuclease PH, partial [Planctomycetota bacterium]|nr:ribonuclease PH [Planctomycetota bacterium]
VDMNIVATHDGRYVEVQGTAEAAPFDRAVHDRLLELADRGIGALAAAQRRVLGDERLARLFEKAHT